MRTTWWFNTLDAISTFNCPMFPFYCNSQKITYRKVQQTSFISWKKLPKGWQRLCRCEGFMTVFSMGQILPKLFFYELLSSSKACCVKNRLSMTNCMPRRRQWHCVAVHGGEMQPLQTCGASCSLWVTACHVLWPHGT